MANAVQRKIWLPVILITIIAMTLTYIFFVAPAPPKTLHLATGSTQGGYYAFAKQYRVLLEAKGLELEIYNTMGSVENLELLTQEDSPIDIAFVQGGVSNVLPEEKRAQLYALASLYSEPLWVFYNKDISVNYLSDLKGKKLAVGSIGSGTRPVVVELLEDNGVNQDNTEFLNISSRDAVSALQKGEIDVAFFIASPKASYVATLLADPEIHLMNFSRIESYTRRYPFLGEVHIGQGLIDFEKNIPEQSYTLLAPKATLVANKNLSPMLIPSIIDILETAHQSGSLSDPPGKFPSIYYTEFPMDERAKRYIERGPSFLYSHFPFWLASSVDRLGIMFVPIIIALIIMSFIIPPFSRWQARSNVYRWYSILNEADRKLSSSNISIEELKRTLDNINLLEVELVNVKVPLSYMGEYYQLRFHLHFLRERLAEVIQRR